MYLIVFDSKCITDNRNRFWLTGETYEQIKQVFPDIINVAQDSIEEVLISSLKRDCATCSVKTAQCKTFVATQTDITIEYENTEELSASCNDVKNRTYGHLMRQGLLAEDQSTPFIVLVDSYRSFLSIKQNVSSTKFKSLMEEINELKVKGDWVSIINKFPSFSEITTSDYWNNVACLNELTFALAKITEPGNKKLDRNLHKQFEEFFYLVANQCIYLEPENSKHKSILAYHYYLRYQKFKSNENGDFDNAMELYKWLVVNSSEKFKEKYRYAKLRQIELESTIWQIESNRYKDLRGLISDYAQLITEYQNLTEDVQKRYATEYIHVLFGHSTLCIDYLFRYWDAYVNREIFSTPISKYLLEKERLDLLLQVEHNLTEIITTRRYSLNQQRVKLGSYPNYFHIYYRLAQVEQSKGIVYIVTKKPQEDCQKFFEQSNTYLNSILTVAKQEQERQRFSYPNYAKLPKAINMFFLGKYDKCHYILSKGQPYEKYEEGVMYYLQRDKSKALEVLRGIPADNNCYKKAQKLIELIENDI